MGVGSEELHSENSSASGLAGWHANLLDINRKKCILFTNDRTLLHFLVPQLSRAEIRRLDEQFRSGLKRLLNAENVVGKRQSNILDEYREIGYAKSNNRSVLGSMNDLADNYTYHIQDKGGLEHCDLMNIIRGLNRMPMGAIDYNSPIEAFSKMYGIDKPPLV